MNQKTDKPELLDDVFAAPADFREALLGTTLRQVRRRRRFRRMRNSAGVFAALALTAILVWQKNVKQNSVAVAPRIKNAVERSYALVTTQPFPQDNIVKTNALGATQIVTSRTSVEIVQPTAGNVHSLNDEELLALTAAHPAILIRTGPHSEQLIFANPQDASGFPAN